MRCPVPGCCAPLSVPAAAFWPLPRWRKSIIYRRWPIRINPFITSGVTEGTETILLFIAFCLWPSLLAPLAWLFGALCWFTTLTRVWGGYHTLRRVAQGE